MVWVKGQSGNPAGKPKGAVDRYAMLRRAIFDAAIQLGVRIQKQTGQQPDKRKALRDLVRAMMVKMLAQEPGNLLRIMVSLLPKEMTATLTVQSFHAELVKFASDMDRVTLPGMLMTLPAGDNGGNDGEDDNGGDRNRMPDTT